MTPADTGLQAFALSLLGLLDPRNGNSGATSTRRS